MIILIVIIFTFMHLAHILYKVTSILFIFCFSQSCIVLHIHLGSIVKEDTLNCIIIHGVNAIFLNYLTFLFTLLSVLC